MTVSRSITLTFDAPDEETAEQAATLLGAIFFGDDVPLHTIDCLNRLTHQGFSSEPVAPVAFPDPDPSWVAGDGHC